MSERSAPDRPVTQPATAPSVPAGLGAALATLPPPWTVFRQGGFSLFDGAAGEIYGGLYLALHPEKGVALVDLAPAQPGSAVPRLRTLLRQTGLAAFTADEPPIIALALTRGEMHTVAWRLAEAFSAATPCRIKNSAWTEIAAGALVARFPHLTQVQRIEGAAVPTEPASGSAAETAFSASALGASELSERAASEARPSPVIMPATVVPLPMRDAAPREQALPHVDMLDPAPEETAQPGRKGRVALGLIAVAAAAAIAIVFLPDHAGIPFFNTPSAPAPGISAEIAPPSEATSPVPPTAAITPLTQEIPAASAPAATAQPHANFVLPPGVARLDDANNLTAVPSSPTPLAANAPPAAESAAAPATAKPAAPASTQTASTQPAATRPDSTQTANTTPPPPAKPAPSSAEVASTNAAIPAPRITKRATAKAAAKAGNAETKAASTEPTTVFVPPRANEPLTEKPQTPAVATRTERLRRRTTEPAPPAIDPEDTVTIDGLTYVKGREPRALGTVAMPPDAAGDQDETASDGAPPADAPAPAAAPPTAIAPVAAPPVSAVLSATPNVTTPQGPAPFEQR